MKYLICLLASLLKNLKFWEAAPPVKGVPVSTVAKAARIDLIVARNAEPGKCMRISSAVQQPDMPKTLNL